jgi:hypothetical protein
MAGTLPIPTIGSANTLADPKIKEALETLNGKLNSENKLLGTNIAAAAEITNAMLSAEAKPFDWYTPKIIATEETRENTAFATLTTKDEITGVVLPENGLIIVGYSANTKSSINKAGRIAIFLGANQLKSQTTGSVAVQEAETESTTLGRTISYSGGLIYGGTTSSADVTTGQALSGGNAAGFGGFCIIFAAAGTYNVSVQYRATSGSVTAKERRLWVAVLGI